MLRSRTIPRPRTSISARARPISSTFATASRVCVGRGDAPLALPEDAILVADDLAPSRFLEIDWTRSGELR